MSDDEPDYDKWEKQKFGQTGAKKTANEAYDFATDYTAANDDDDIDLDDV